MFISEVCTKNELISAVIKTDSSTDISLYIETFDWEVILSEYLDWYITIKIITNTKSSREVRCEIITESTFECSVERRIVSTVNLSNTCNTSRELIDCLDSLWLWSNNWCCNWSWFWLSFFNWSFCLWCFSNWCWFDNWSYFFNWSYYFNRCFLDNCWSCCNCCSEELVSCPLCIAFKLLYCCYYECIALCWVCNCYD